MECKRLEGYRDLSLPDGRVTPCCLYDINKGWESNIYTGVDRSEWTNPIKEG